MTEKLGERVALAREARDLSQTALANAADLSQTAVSKIERGKIAPEPATLARLADALTVSVRWLRDGEGPGPIVDAKPLSKPPQPSRHTPAQAFAPPSGTRHEAELVAALDEVFDRARGHSLVDVNTVLALFRDDLNGGEPADPQLLRRAALRMLDSVTAIRREGRVPTLREVMLRAASG